VYDEGREVDCDWPLREKNRGRAGRSFSLADPWRQAELDSYEAKKG